MRAAFDRLRLSGGRDGKHHWGCLLPPASAHPLSSVPFPLPIARWRLAPLEVGCGHMEFARKLGGTAWHGVSCLLLLLIAFHASVPVSAPLERVSGSAFSAATAEVSVLRGRAAAPSQRIAGITPVPGMLAGASAGFGPMWGMVLRPASAWWHVLPPPLRVLAASALAARAPPAA